MKSYKKPKAQKPPKAIRRIHKKIGDVIEVPTSKGLAYVQYTHENKTWGSLIRVLQGFYKTRPSNETLEKVVQKPHRFQTFCPVHYGVNIGVWERFGNFPVPDFAQKFPTFKNSSAPPKSDLKEVNWSLWNGENPWRVGKLSLEEQKKYPFHAICNDTGLVHHIETGKNNKGWDLC